jgi:hypothetical protein
VSFRFFSSSEPNEIALVGDGWDVQCRTFEILDLRVCVVTLKRPGKEACPFLRSFTAHFSCCD